MATLIFIPREILLVEIDRRCFFPDCNARTLVGLTKREASDYQGFECAVCKRWNDDKLGDKDVPDAWKPSLNRSINAGRPSLQS